MMMKLAVLAILGASVAAVPDSTITLYARQATTVLPSSASMTSPPLTTLEPSSTLRDPWQCATQNLSQYFDVPKPSGTLSAAIDMYVDELVEPCLETATGADLFNCRVTESSQLCGFTTFASATPALITAFASYESAAASFWRSNSASVSSLSVECASAWNHFGELKHAWLNQTIAYASCVLEDLPPVSTTIASSGSSTAPGTAVTGTTSSTTNTAGLAKRTDMWMLAGTGVIAGAANVFA
ncbi:hypothetical protein K4K54_008869 [Colletotrichum sp. SAR 10_86]|nr:hypothetical protein K4K52_008330 [Colletotrichum sp. SAR 10_76]KAI8217757.1 hypothetical protein K4K53_009021 [Colletotrichum sp. SAR 10_77]KAI8220133.1 hypothetical protein K4K54_008869 [Colletotrichum sp. SAR 10_86]KAI8262411.1 hypothetical protein K4K56_005862 [Colletotrichum sp. SAR 10_98]